MIVFTLQALAELWFLEEMRCLYLCRMEAAQPFPEPQFPILAPGRRALSWASPRPTWKLRILAEAVAASACALRLPHSVCAQGTAACAEQSGGRRRRL